MTECKIKFWDDIIEEQKALLAEKDAEIARLQAENKQLKKLVSRDSLPAT